MLPYSQGVTKRSPSPLPTDLRALAFAGEARNSHTWERLTTHHQTVLRHLWRSALSSSSPPPAPLLLLSLVLLPHSSLSVQHPCASPWVVTIYTWVSKVAEVQNLIQERGRVPPHITNKEGNTELPRPVWLIGSSRNFSWVWSFTVHTVSWPCLSV